MRFSAPHGSAQPGSAFFDLDQIIPSTVRGNDIWELADQGTDGHRPGHDCELCVWRAALLELKAGLYRVDGTSCHVSGIEERSIPPIVYPVHAMPTLIVLVCEDVRSGRGYRPAPPAGGGGGGYYDECTVRLPVLLVTQ